MWGVRIIEGKGVRMPPHPECDKVHVGVCLIVMRWIDNIEHWCMFKRKGAHGPGTWSVPGGWMEHGESPQDAVLREFMEEVGTKMTFISPVFRGITNDIQDELHSVTIWFETDYINGEPENMEPEKIEEIKWIAKNDFNTLKLFRPMDILISGGML